jgi:simple sugar transport system permease protein
MATAEARVDERVRRVGLASVLLARPEIGAVIGAILIWIVFAVWTGGRGFLTVAGTASYLDVAAQVGIVASAVALLMIAGEFDLSVGSVVGAAGMVLAIGVGEFGLPVWLSILLAIALGLVIGFVNGYVVVRTRLPSFIVTLGTLFVLRGVTIGLTRAITGRTQVGGLGEEIAADPIAGIFRADIGPFSSSILWWVGLALIATFVLLRTPFGNWIYGSGGSAVAARNVGVPVDRVKILLFMATGGSAALLAVIQVMTVGTADVLRGEQKEFEAIITAVIGGTLLTGGYGSAIGPVFGALTLGMTRVGIQSAGVPGDWYLAFLGVLLLAAVIVNNYIRQRAAQTRH